MRENNQELKTAWEEFISRHPFEWFVTLTFRYPVSSTDARKHCLEWVRSICLKEHLQIAALVVFNDSKQCHLHLLMLGRNRDGKNLSTVSKEYWSKQWSKYKCGCLIEQVYDCEGAANYLVKNMNLYKDDPDNVLTYNHKLLKKTALVNGNAIQETFNTSQAKLGDNLSYMEETQ